MIELLVVVLIIGILAAIALPQYLKAVEKSRAAEAWVIIKNMHDALERTRLNSGVYANDFEVLDITFQADEDASLKHSDDVTNPIKTKTFVFHLTNECITAERVPDRTKYALRQYLTEGANALRKGTRGCVAYDDKNAEICESMAGDLSGTESGAYYYMLQ